MWITGQNTEKQRGEIIIKFKNSLENGGILLTGTSEKVINQKVGFADSLIRAGLPLMKNVPTLLAKNVLPLLLVIINKYNNSKKKLIDKAWLRWESKIEKCDISWNYLHILKKHIYWWKMSSKKNESEAKGQKVDYWAYY